MPLFPTEPSDLAAAADFVNAAYRGDASRRGWTTEADYMDGTRTTAEMLASDLASQPQARLFVLRADAGSPILGTVWLEPTSEEVWTIGMLTVRPDQQAAGLGRRLLAEAEAVAIQQGARRIVLTVINVRATLIAWYERRGYHLTGETRPFPYEDKRFGLPRRDDLHFVVLEKLGDDEGQPHDRPGAG